MATTDPTLQRFTGFPKGGVAFFRTLALRQDRAWFHQHKEDFRSLWEGPMRAFLAEVHQGLVTTFPTAKKTKSKIFRIYRDTRFSKDKSPFKTSISGVIPLYEGGMMERTGLYFEFGPESFVAVGRWMMEPPVLKRFRKVIADDRTGAPFAKAVAKVTGKGAEVTVTSMEQLKRVPTPWPKDHPREALLRHKGFAFSLTPPTEKQLASPALVTTYVTRVQALAPMLKWVESAARGKRPSFS